jgi:hypothetical protein
MMHAESLVNLPILFDYYPNRWNTTMNGLANAGTSNNIYVFHRDWWNAYNNIAAPSGGGQPANVNPTISLTSSATQEITTSTGTLTATYADSDGTVSSVGWARTFPTATSGSCSLAAGTATCSGVGAVDEANNTYTLTATDNSGGTATTSASILRRTCPATPADTFTVNGGWATSLGPCYTYMTTTQPMMSSNEASASIVTTRHLALMPWSGGAPDDYKVQVTATSLPTEASFLLFGCMGSRTAVDNYNGYVMSMQGNGTNLAKYTAGVRSSLASNTQPADGGWIAGETGTLECEDTGSSTILTAKDQNGATIVSATDSTGSRYSSGDPFIGAWGGATFDNFASSSIVGGPGPDTTPPTLIITVPASNPSTTSDASYNLLQGTAADNIGVATVTCINLTTSTSCTTSGTTAWSVPTVNLTADTSNTIRMQACDAALNCSAPVETIITHQTGISVVAAITYPGVARAEPYDVYGDQMQLRGTCTSANHVEVFINGAAVGAADSPVSSSYISGTTSWAAIKPIPVGLDPSAIRAIEVRCVAGDASYSATQISITLRSLRSRR